MVDILGIIFSLTLMNEIFAAISTYTSREKAGNACYLINQGNAEAPGMLVLSEIGIIQAQNWYKLAPFIVSQYQGRRVLPISYKQTTSSPIRTSGRRLLNIFRSRGGQDNPPLLLQHEQPQRVLFASSRLEW